MTADKNPLLTLTDAAVNRVKSIMDNANSEVIGLRIGIKTAGCSGMKYNVEYATEIKPYEEKIISKGLVICIDPAAIMFLIGSSNLTCSFTSCIKSLSEETIKQSWP